MCIYRFIHTRTPAYSYMLTYLHTYTCYQHIYTPSLIHIPHTGTIAHSFAHPVSHAHTHAHPHTYTHSQSLLLTLTQAAQLCFLLYGSLSSEAQPLLLLKPQGPERRWETFIFWAILPSCLHQHIWGGQGASPQYLGGQERALAF